MKFSGGRKLEQWLKRGSCAITLFEDIVAVKWEN